MRKRRRLLRGGDARLLGAPVWWLFDAAVLWAAFHALGAPPALAVLAFAYFAGQVGNTIPIPGAVSGGMVGTLLAFGVAPDLALTSVLPYRAVAIWLPAPAGLLALGALRSRVARWTAEDRVEAEAPAVVVVPESDLADAPRLTRRPIGVPAGVVAHASPPAWRPSGAPALAVRVARPADCAAC